MKKYYIFLSALLLLFIGLPESKVSAAIADGTFSLNYQVNKPESSSASMANDYFLKPGKLIVSNGSMKIQLTIKNSTWVTEFNPPGGATVISADPSADQRVVQFSIANLNTLKVAMKIDIDDIDYHHGYTVDFVFDSSGLPEKEEKPASTPPSSNNAGSSTSTEQKSSGTTPTQNKSDGTVTEQATPSSNSGQSTTDSNEIVETEDPSLPNQNEEPSATTNQEENPETSDQLPLLAMLLFAIAFAVFIRSKKKRTV